MSVSPVPWINCLTKYGTKIGGIYKASSTMSITPGADIVSNGSNGIIGTIRWTNPDYAAIITAFGFQVISTTGFASAGPMGITVYKCTGYTAVDTGGTPIISSFGTPLITGMPSSRVANVVSCGPSVASPGTAALTAGTRTLSNPMYTTTAIIQNSASTSQPGTIWQLTWNEDEPMVLLANEGFEYQIPMGLTLSQNKNLTVNMISTWMEVPREIIYERYGI